jgi:hypothetical protein
LTHHIPEEKAREFIEEYVKMLKQVVYEQGDFWGRLRVATYAFRTRYSSNHFVPVRGSREKRRLENRIRK